MENRNESWPPRGKGLNCFFGNNLSMKPPILYEQNALFLSPNSARILVAIASVHKESSDLQQFLHDAFLGFGHALHNTEQIFFLGRRFSEAPSSP